MRDIGEMKKELKGKMESILGGDRGASSPDEDIRAALKKLDDQYTSSWLWWHLELHGKRLLEASKLAKELMYAYRNEELPKELTPEDFAMGLLKAMAGTSKKARKNEETNLKKYRFWQKIFCKKHSNISNENSDYSGGFGCSSCSV